MTEIDLIIRKCVECGNEAVPLDGEGTECIECSGVYGPQTGVKTVDVKRHIAKGFAKTNPEAVN